MAVKKISFTREVSTVLLVILHIEMKNVATSSTFPVYNMCLTSSIGGQIRVIRVLFLGGLPFVITLTADTFWNARVHCFPSAVLRCWKSFASVSGFDHLHGSFAGKPWVVWKKEEEGERKLNNEKWCHDLFLVSILQLLQLLQETERDNPVKCRVLV